MLGGSEVLTEKNGIKDTDPQKLYLFFSNVGFTTKKPVNLTLMLVNLILWSTGQTG